MDEQTLFQSILSKRAQEEVIQSWKWYEERQAGLGDRFLREVLQKIKIIENYPYRYPIRFKSYRESLVPIFPFIIIYRLNEIKQIVRIVSVFHTSMNPARKY